MPNLMRHGPTFALLMLGFSQAGAQTVAPAIQGASTANPVAVPSGRETFAQRAEIEMKEWDLRFHDFSNRAQAEDEAAGSTSDRDLHAAWTDTREAAHKLRTATAHGWQKAKAYYERKAQDLQGAWNRVHPA